MGRGGYDEKIVRSAFPVSGGRRKNVVGVGSGRRGRRGRNLGKSFWYGNRSACFVSENGTVYLLRGNYPLTTQFNLNKAGVTLEGSRGTVLTLEAALIPFLITAADVTLRGLTLTSDAPYANEWIQVGGDGALIEDNTIFGPHKSKRFDTDRRRG